MLDVFVWDLAGRWVFCQKHNSYPGKQERNAIGGGDNRQVVWSWVMIFVWSWLYQVVPSLVEPFALRKDKAGSYTFLSSMVYACCGTLAHFSSKLGNCLLLVCPWALRSVSNGYVFPSFLVVFQVFMHLPDQCSRILSRSSILNISGFLLIILRVLPRQLVTPRKHAWTVLVAGLHAVTSYSLQQSSMKLLPVGLLWRCHLISCKPTSRPYMTLWLSLTMTWTTKLWESWDIDDR